MKFAIILFPILITTIYFGQDPVYNINDNSQVYSNPAYTGTIESSSVDLIYKNQWPELSGNYVTTAFQMNQYLGKGNGVSFNFVNDIAANSWSTNVVNLSYGKSLIVSNDHVISLGGQFGMIQKSVDLDQQTFGTNIDPQTGFVFPQTSEQIKSSITNFDASVGVMYYNKRLFAGISARHLTSPNMSVLVGGESSLPIFLNGELGAKLKLENWSFTPTVRYFQQESFSLVISRLKVNFKKLEINGGYISNTGFFGGLGFYGEKFNIGYTYALNQSSFGGNATTHELRLGTDLQIFKKLINENKFDF